jgi:large conductance mechanosensitive channel
VLAYGLFINAVVKFTIVAFVLFLVVKGVNRLKKPGSRSPHRPAGPHRPGKAPHAEIRDAIKTKGV